VHLFDYIIVDMSPSAWIVNELIVSSCHWLVVPCSPDYYSSMAMRSLVDLLKVWDDNKEAIRARHRAMAATRFHLPQHKPIFIGHTFQLYFALHFKGHAHQQTKYRVKL
jgi:chromosome partitioning protein